MIIGDIDASSGNYHFNGKISNLRIVKGTAVYTSAFKPPTEPLTNITNTKLLCLQNSSNVDDYTVSPGAISEDGSPGPALSSNSPFDDPAGFVFGDAEDQNVIKCGSYTGTGSAGLEVNLGWEPSWILLKAATGSAKNWCLFDSMRGIVSGGNDNALFPNDTEAEQTGFDRLRVTSTGFQIDTVGGYSDSGVTYVYTCIRRSDGYVGKPPALGTGVFAASYNTSNAPWFKNNNFPVDLSIHKRYDQSEDWYEASRLQGTYGLRTSTTAAEANITSYWQWDYMEGWNSYESGTAAGNYISYQFKRHAGFDVVTYKGSGLSAGDQQDVPHSMNKTPEMMIVKIRDAANQSWMVYHKGLNGGTNPEQYKIELNSTGAESSFNCWDNTAPNANSFRVGNQVETNHGSYNFIAMLFASVDGISKVGSYSGPGGVVTITTGFQPRFIMVKKTNGAGGWHVFDTTRGMGSGNDPLLYLNTNGAQITVDYVTPSSTGWSTTSGNLSEGDYIYYAHA